MNLTNVKTPVIIGGVLLLSALTLIAFLAFRRGSSPKEYIPSPLPPYSPKALPQTQDFEDELKKVKEKLPFAGENFSIEYLAQANIINGKIKGTSREELALAKFRAEEALKEHGATNLCALKIFWLPQTDQEVRKTLDESLLVTTNCTVE